MNRESFKDVDDAQNGEKEENFYSQYRELGGIINERDCESALAKAKNTTEVAPVLVTQAECIAEFAGIKLHSTEGALDPVIVLYAALRTDVNSEKVVHHHSQMCDQRLFAEALRMLGYTDSLDKLLRAYPNIIFT